MIRECVVCGKEFDGTTQHCSPECYRILMRDKMREYRAEHRKQINARARIQQSKPEYRARRKEYERKWQEEHPGYAHKWQTEHPGYTAEQARKQRAEHPDYGRKWKEKHPGYDAARSRRMRKEHPEREKAYKLTRRGNGGTVPINAETIFELKSEYGGICPYCNERIVKGHIDHIVPVSRGGMTERENLVWVCQRCNAQKHNKSLLEFLLRRATINGAPDK